MESGRVGEEPLIRETYPFLRLWVDGPLSLQE